jgi:cell surface protein SprA
MTAKGPANPYELLAPPAPPTDTIPPIQDRYEVDPANQRSNPFDIDDPEAIDKNIEYDPATGQYILRETIGENTYFRPPSYLTFDEYMELRRKQDEKAYFDQLSGISRGGNLSIEDPLSVVDVEDSLIDRLFGGNTVSIEPQGGVDLTFGIDHQRLENPILTERQRSTTIFDFDMDIQMNVTGSIGEKLKLNTNFNTGATFNFDNQIKLDYNSDLFSEDDIIKKIEAGNVALPLRGSLIQGAQSLFGIKTELQFGHLRLTAIASQQQSERENITVQGGSQLQDFEVRADEYDENRHFFLSHYNRNTYEGALSNLPQINTLFQLETIEVWITNDRNEVTDVRDIVALADLGEPERLTNPEAVGRFPEPRYREICEGRPLPENGANDLYGRLIARGEAIREIDRSVAILQSSRFNMQQARDFEKVSARKLSPREYTVHSELGFISLNINVQPDQVVGVAYRYKYNGEIFRVGELSTVTDDVSADTTNLSNRVLFVKMLKSTTQRVGQPTWDLMMKNVYSLGAYQVNPEDFQLDVLYEDPGEGFKRFLPTSNLEGIPLIRVFGLDRLNTQGDPVPDGIFDFVPGLTINPQNGRIYFPKLEPFGSDLADEFDSQQAIDRYVYQELYDSTLFRAQEFPEKNRFLIKGNYKSSVSSEISLGAFNIPPGSVRVTAGGAQLIEGRDYEVDYSTGRVRILNDALLSSGVPVNVSFEDNTVFALQQKTMLGLRADYTLSDDINIGATFMQLFERPFTPKVNIGEDPINNKIYGVDLTMTKDAPFLTRLVDKLPLYSTSQPSSISLTAEAAYLRPGHSRAINQGRRRDGEAGGIVYVDDFEGSAAPLDVSQPVNRWFLASVPRNDAQNSNPLFPEANEFGLAAGANRAQLNWYRIDPSARRGDDTEDVYVSTVPQQEVFPNRTIQPSQQQAFLFQTFDLSFDPTVRGPYNFDRPDGGYPGLTAGVQLESTDTLAPVKLNAPATRWGGIMRALTTNDFQTANIEFMEFWLLSPFLDPLNPQSAADDANRKQGSLYINLGNISEDILPDSRRFFENGLPGPSNPNRPTDETVWGRIPVGQQITRAFDNDLETRARQDVGLDGFDDAGERNKYADWFNEISGVNPVAAQFVANDPANDNFVYYNSNAYDDEQGIRLRYRKFNNPQGNSQQPEGNSNIRTAGTNIPDAEDLDQDNTLNESESYFQYEIPLRIDPTDPRRLAPNTPFITDQIEAPNGRVWYRFRIPVNTPLKKSVGGIQDFRSIRFMRMYMRGFEAPVILRFAKFELVRNQWRRFTRDFLNEDTPPVISGSEDTDFNIDAVNIEENSRRFPVAYTLPRGIAREQNLGIINTLQNEQSLALRVDNLYPGDRRAVFKYTNTDMRLYERLKMFVHAEPRDRENPLAAPEDGEMSLFLRLGSDFENNYYEYEIPLTMSDLEVLAGISNTNSNAYKDEVWLAQNELDFPLQILKELKLERNDLDFSPGQEYGKVYIPDNRPDAEHIIRVKGNPNLGYVKVMMIGVKNRNDINTDAVSAEVWVNELRLEGLDERGGTAALARMDVQLADLGNLTMAGNFNSIGFGALDNKLLERSRERTISYDVAANLNLDKFLPEEWGLRIPFYAQHSNVVSTPEFDPYDLDLKLQEKTARADSPVERDSLREQAQERTKITTYNFTNVRKERTGGGGGGVGGGAAQPKPWDISNFSLSYSYTNTEFSDPFIKLENTEEYTGAIDYTFARTVNYVEPFKGLESKYLRLLREFNFNPLPNSFSVTNILDRTLATTSYRFAGGVDERFNTFYNKRFLWNRNYDLQWDLTKSLKIGFNAQHNATIDEPDEARLAENPNITDLEQYRRDSIWDGLRDFGRPKLYQHGINASYTLPLRYLPFMEWVQVRAQYQGSYTWTAAALNTDSLGNVIQNSQNRQLTADLNFERFYDQFRFLQQINRRQRAPARGRPARGAPTDTRDDSRSRREGEVAPLTKALIRPLLFLRRARLTYSEQLATIVPGYRPTTNVLGQAPGFNSPGWDFVAGLQPNIGPEYWGTDQDWLMENKEWITDNVFFNQDVVQNKSTTWDGQLTLEPVNDFRIDLTWNRVRRDDYTETFKVLDVAKGPNGEPIPGAAGYEHAVPTFGGSLTTTYGALKVPFTTDTSQLLSLFQDFESYRRIISQRLGDGTPHQDPNLAARGFADGYGPNQQDVLLPAFIAAYTGQDPSTVSLDVFDQATRPNWRATYNGLSRLPGLRDIFSNFSISHGYQATLAINNYRTSLDYLATLQELPPGTTLAFDTVSLNYFPRIEIPDVVIQEAFAPVVALEMTLTNGMSFNFDYKQSRTRAANVTSKLLSETVSKEFVGGFGYVLNGVNIGFLTGGGGGSRRDEEQPPAPPGGRRPGGSRSGGRLNVQDMDIQFNFSLRDDVTFARKLEQGISEPTRGTYTLSFSPSAEYQLNQQLALRLFFDYRRSIPRNTLGYPQTTANGGVVVRFMLN